MTRYFVPGGTTEAGATQQRAMGEAGGRQEWAGERRREAGASSRRGKEGARKKEEEVRMLLLQKEAQDITSSTGVCG